MEEESLQGLLDAKEGDGQVKLVMQELKENPYRNFEIAFSLMSIIPFLVFLYLLVSRLFTFEILIGDIGLVIFICITLSLCGFFLGYNIIKRSLNRIVFYAAKAKRSDQLKSKFVSTVSHDLRNPLFVLDANVTDMEDGSLGIINEKQKEVMGTCKDVVDRMSKLTNDLLDLYKIEAGMVKLSKKPLSLTDMEETQLKEQEIIINKKRINLIKEIEQTGLSFKGDENMIAQVISNILSNAIKFTPENGIIAVRAFPSSGFVRMEFTDSGKGIPPDKLDRIFDKFERLDTDKKGSGLGLAIAKDIVELHKGKIWAESPSEQGNTFIIVLPAG
jgi:signal transduction histidine kinase